jgi:hypothetical protein
MLTVANRLTEDPEISNFGEDCPESRFLVENKTNMIFGSYVKPLRISKI